MTSYVYNPSKVVTDLLSRYLEFDPEQLQLGIWSGNLTLSNVNLRQEAIYPVLNSHLNKAASKKGNSSAAFSSWNEQQQDYVKPPLKFKLVSGKIGSLSMKIPWKRLVWGQGDVQVDIRNVVVVLALESREESESRVSKESTASGTNTSDEQSNPETDSNIELDRDALLSSRFVSRSQKQKVLREAEKRLTRGRSLGPWLSALKKKEEEEQLKKGLTNGESSSLKDKESHMLKWLRSTTSDFFWRFCVGLQMNVENVKIVIVQDSIEIGIIMPSNKVIAGKPVERRPVQRRKSSVRSNLRDVEEDETDSVLDSYSVSAPQNMIYKGECDDGEHVDKQMKHLGIGIYVRKLNHLHKSHDFEHTTVNVLTADYVLRPLDVDFNFSLFFPLPSEKRKRKSQMKPVEDRPVDSASVETSPKPVRRRGKREKTSIGSSDALTETTAPVTILPTAGNLTLSPQKRPSSDINISNHLTPKVGRRMSTMSSKTMHANSMHSTTPVNLSRTSHMVSALPLARPDDIGGFYARTAKVANAGRTARFDGRLSVGAIQLVCSSRHYHLINEFLAAGARMRNGRPTVSIRSVLERERASQKQDDALDESSAYNSGVLESDNARLQRTEVVKSWWRYVFGVMFWELQQRKRLRTIFQQKYLSFSWDKQSYMRSEYVKSFIACRLRRGGSAALDWQSSTTPRENTLLEIEDELLIEQVLLYRSIARSIYVGGGSEMPASILDLRREREQSAEIEMQDIQGYVTQTERNHEVGDEHVFSVTDDIPSFLTMLEDRCETARKRNSNVVDDGVPGFLPFGKRAHSIGGLDEMSFGLISESKTIKTARSSKSRPTVASTAMETISSDESASAGMMFEFSVKIEKLELLVVEEDNGTALGDQDQHSSSSSEDISHSSLNMSDVSVLTDDERFFRDEEDMSPAEIEESEATETMFPSADYLYFKVPDNIILQLELVSLSCSTLGRFGGSRNINFSIGQINAVGEQKVRLLMVGSSLHGEAPVPEIQVPKDNVGSSLNGMRSATSSDALRLVFVDKNYHNFLQCDAPTIRTWIMTSTVSKLLSFSSHSSAHYPQFLLAKSPKETVRMHVLRQSENVFTALNCSIRIHGCEINLPPATEDDIDDTSNSTTRVVCDMIEMYSGSAVDDLCASMETWPLASEQGFKHLENVATRQLRMLDVPELIAINQSFLSSHWVVALSGLDVRIFSKISSELSLLEDPVDIEVLYTMNSDSLLDFNRAKQEVVVEVSPAHIMLTEERARQLSKLDCSLLFRSSSKLSRAKEQLPPRLEVLSNYMRSSVELSFRRLRVSFFSEGHSVNESSTISRHANMEDCMCDFLRVVSRFDLSFPHEDSLSAAMQICIDRLAGKGLALEDSWEATNLVLLNFLEDIAAARKSDVPNQSHEGSTDLDQDQKIVQSTIRTSAQRTIKMYVDRLQLDDLERQLGDNDVVMDLPDGLSVRFTGLFYDHHFCMEVPTVFMANGSGVHFLRVTPTVDSSIESSDPERKDESELPDDAESSVESRFGVQPQNQGIVWQQFLLDKEYSFGKGGLPLSILGTDTDSSDREARSREKLNDMEVGEVELLFSCVLLEKAYESLSRILLPLKNVRPAATVPDPEKGVPSQNCDSCFVLSAVCASALFLSDNLNPFTRIILYDITTKSREISDMTKNVKDGVPCQVSVQSFGILNLTPEGELFPAVVDVLPDCSGPGLRIEFPANSKGSVDVEFEGLRLVVLRQFINECFQFFVSSHYGIGKLTQYVKKREQDGVNDSTRSNPLALDVSVLDSSVLLPRSTSSYDMIGIEIGEAKFSSLRTDSSFSLPTKTSKLELHQNQDNSGSNLTVNRKRIALNGFRVFSSLHENEFHSGDATIDSPSFRFFFDINGRAESGKRVYSRRTNAETRIESDEETINLARSKRRWSDLTTKATSLEVFVDYAPHLRILICDVEGIASPGLELDVRLSQFCLLLSMWYSNMQELPLMFPFSASQLQEGSRLLHRSVSFPELGTQQFLSFLGNHGTLTSEFAVVSSFLSLRCALDEDHGRKKNENGHGLCLGFRNVCLHVQNDSKGVVRIGSGSSEAFLVDESQEFNKILSIKGRAERNISWADMRFALKKNRESLGMTLPQAFQLSVHMTPELSLYNLGMDTAFITLSDFSPIFKFLDFVSSYFKDSKLGHPAFEAAERANKIRTQLILACGSQNKTTPDREDGADIDFRLWLTKPTMTIPCDPDSTCSPGLRIECDGGLWYKYSCIESLSSQECISDSLNLYFDKTCMQQEFLLHTREKGRSLLEKLSLGIRIDSNTSSNHTDMCCQIPFVEKDACGIISKKIYASPAVFAPPTICTPYQRPERSLGPRVCEVTCLIELLPLISSALLNLFSGPSNLEEDSTSQISIDDVSTEVSPGTLSLVANVGDVRVFVLDPILGPHLPVAVVSISSMSVTSSQFSTENDEFSPGSVNPGDLQISVECQLWADYFKLGLTRSWEPLIEAYKFNALYEKSAARGSGLSFNSDCSLHLNISSALLVILDEVVDVYRRLVHHTFNTNDEPSTVDDSVRNETGKVSKPLILSDSYENTEMTHEIPLKLGEKDRVAFSVRNRSGQRIRILGSSREALHNTSVKPASLKYIDHSQSTMLSFLPSISMVKNLHVTEVAYPGFSESNRCIHKSIPSHTIDIQLPGFDWLERIAVDTFGRSFASITPRAPDVVAKISSDWRLANVMKLMVEIGLENGGRQVTVRSVFSVVNKTTHDVNIFLNPDPTLAPHSRHSMSVLATLDECEKNGQDLSNHSTEHKKSSDVVQPGCSLQIPILLFESSLRQQGSHLGSMWLKPCSLSSDSEYFRQFLADATGTATAVDVDFSSRPVQFAKVVSESSAIFDATDGRELGTEDSKTGVELACPSVQENGDQLAPFCYALEIARSPLVLDGLVSKSKSEKKRKARHGPVAYTISIHPPLVISNLLPEKGRFELMHAVNRTVLWFGDLEPGQQIPVHSVGLDAPLLLFVNLGFGKTPVGGGALVHHGANAAPGMRENMGGLKQIGKAGKAVTKQLGKTLVSMGESPDHRGQQKVLKAQNTHFHAIKKKGQKNVLVESDTDLGHDNDNFGHEKIDGKTYKMDTFQYYPQDVVNHTTIVDTLGQRLTLNIENDRGGGGQRKISIFCRFWILNTTEHCLRYRQENSSLFVSGTVVSPNRNGSLPYGGGRLAQQDKEQKHAPGNKGQLMTTGTVFSGTPGALATHPGKCNLEPGLVTELLDKNLSLERIATLAFMFSFQEGPVLAIGHQKLCVQVGDGTGATNYESDWSRSFSVDTVGISQIVSMHCKDGRALELNAVVHVAPGFLSSYTKIIRFLPRHVVVNNLPYPIRIWQDSSIFRPLSADASGANDRTSKWRYSKERSKKNNAKVNQYESLWGREVRLDEKGEKTIGGTAAHPSALYVCTVLPSEVIPFCLPDSRGERQLRVDLTSPWNLTASFLADTPADHILKIQKAVDLRTIPHASTRSNPHYEVRLPPDDDCMFAGELGVWFETEWGSTRSLIVKGIKKNSYAFNETDIHVGDELLALDRAPVSRMTFAEAMNLLQRRLGEVSQTPTDDDTPKLGRRRFGARTRSGLHLSNDIFSNTTDFVLKFRTVEERLRSVRRKAARASGDRRRVKIRETPGHIVSPYTSSPTPTKMTSSFIQAELKTIQRSDVGIYLFLRDKPEVTFQIQNRSISSTIYYRQKGCSQHNWASLKPGQSRAYTWEEPLKPKRLTVRAASDSAFQVLDDRADVPIPSRTRQSARLTDPDTRRSRIPFRTLKDEVDAVFSNSVNARLEEIGYHELLPLHTSGAKRERETASSSSPKFLNLQVVVEGETRALLVNDGSGEGGEQQMSLQIQSLENALNFEKKRYSELKLIDVYLTPPDIASAIKKSDNLHAAERSKKLMDDFSTESTISSCHQIVVEVLEAIGLSPESFVGSCNPYAEAWLKSSLRRRSLFQKRSVQKTYYVRKSVNPTWNAQSFVFDVPEHAVNVTRGHSVQIRLRNFQSVGNHEVLGRSQVDLHSVRDQKPVVGWFPLAGRTGRRELDNELSHWGRGSVKLRVQWIHSVPSLVDYFLLLCERRLCELQDSLEGMAQQLSKEKETEEKRKAEIDGFKAVRLQELLSFSKTKNNKRTAQLSKLKKLNHAVVKKILEPLRPASSKKGFVDSKMKQLSSSADTNETTEDFLDETEAVAFLSPNGSDNLRRRLNRPNLVAQQLEDKISFHRKNFQNLTTSRIRSEHTSDFISDESGVFSVSSFKFWSSVQVVFQNMNFDTELNGDKIIISLRQDTGNLVLPFSSDQPAPQDYVSRKICTPTKAPPLIKLFAQRHASEFLGSRLSFERAARMSLRTVLNPGGWLTIRPVTARNLPDSYTGMFVKVRYGSEVLVSETVDAKVLDPTWNTLNDKNQQDESDNIRKDGPTISSFEVNDLHIRVAPQKTNGSIQLSVFGEKSHQQLQGKSELGVLHLPLGSAIATCMDYAESCKPTKGMDKFESSMYIRWFPLKNPKDVVQVEGDGKLSARSRDTEKTSEGLFRDYFAPCIQLALVWSPDKRDGEDNAVGRSEAKSQPSAHSRVSQPPLVTHYFNADIGRISLALIDSQCASELLAFSSHDIDIRYWVTKAKTRVGISVGWIQLDYQDDSVREPVVLAPTPTDSLIPVLQILAVQDNLRSEGHVTSIDFIDISMAEFDLTIEECLVFDIFGFFRQVDQRKGLKLRAANRSKADTSEWGSSAFYDARSDKSSSEKDEELSLLSILRQDQSGKSDSQRKVYIKQLFLGVVKLNLSYLRGRRLQYLESGINSAPRSADTGNQLSVQLDFYDDSDSKESDAFAAWSQHTSDEEYNEDDGGKVSKNLPTLFASLFPTLSDAPVRLPGKALNHIFERPSEILNSVRKFYVNETLKQIYKIIGSLDFVGNPTMLVTSFFSGVRDLVVAPSAAFMKSPTDPSRVGLGMAQGTISLVSHSTSGFFGVMAKVSAAAGQGVAVLSLDKDFRDWHRDKVVLEATNLNREWKRRGVQSLRRMLTRPLADLVLGASGGVFGTILSPVKGYKANGSLGLLKGVAVGGIGLIAKPTVGVLDALTHFTSSIHDIAKSVNVLDRRLQPALKVRLPYTFGMRSILAPYDPAAARAAVLLRQFPRKEPTNNDTPETLIHVEILASVSTETFAIATSARVLLVRVRKDVSGAAVSSLCWQVAFTGEAGLSSRVEDHGHSGVALSLFKRGLEDQNSTADSVVCAENSMVSSPTFISQNSMGLSTPMDRLPLANTESSFNHGTGRGAGGELLDWFTILAEYPHRRQLTRFHNAVSCIAGKLDEVIYDPSVGHADSTQGYTSFGMFLFEGNQSPEYDSHGQTLHALRNLPWVNESTFAAIQDKPPGEQKRHLSELRGSWSFENELEASEFESGPDWIIFARARARYADGLDDSSPLRSNIPGDDSSATCHLPTIVDNESDATLSSQKSDRLGSLSRFSPGFRRSSLQVWDRRDESSPGKFSFTGRRSSRSPEFTKQWCSSEAFVSAEMGLSPSQGGSVRDDLRALPTTPMSGSLVSPSMNAGVMEQAYTPELLSVIPESNAVSPTHEPSHSSEQDHTRSNRSDRMDRLEAFMERLLIFSSEQALRTTTSQEPTPGVDQLREEVAALRSQILEAATVSPSEIISLRQELAMLRAQVTGSTAETEENTTTDGRTEYENNTATSTDADLDVLE